MGIDPRQPGQRPRIEPIVFPATLSDQAHVARMNHDRFAPQLLSNRLPHGECTPVSSAIRLRGIPPNTPCITFGVVESFSSRTTPLHPERSSSSLDRPDPSR
jgi:hypothetical protein